MSVSQALRERVSARFFDPTGILDDERIRALIALAMEAPSSFNIQHARFIAVTDPALKVRLRAASNNQQKVQDAAVTFVILGDLRAHEDFAARTAAAAQAGRIPAEVAARQVEQSASLYADPAKARDEALRSVGLAAMALMLAAHDLGLASCPMIGFDPQKVSELLHVPPRYFPAMMVALGPGSPGNGPRKPRLGTNVVLRFNDGGDFPA